jgi:threonine/homoserine/homoserine lactone efflux protein
MITFLTVLVILGMLATVGTLFAGMVGIARPGSSPQRSNRLMRWRVILQGVTLVLFALLLLLLRH